jgi:hypothetical protein
MEAKFYECDDELATVLLNHGFIETTNQDDKRKGKKEFRLGPRRSRMLLRFDYINFHVFEDASGCNFRSTKIPANELKMLLWYVQSSTVDKNHISDGHFDLYRVKQNVETMTSLLGCYKEFNRQNAESKRFARLLNNLHAVHLN